MFAIEVHATFCATHQLRLPGDKLEPQHGHDWCVTARVASQQLDALETVMDFHILERMLKEICDCWHYRHLNDIAPFDRTINPSARARGPADCRTSGTPNTAAGQTVECRADRGSRLRGDLHAGITWQPGRNHITPLPSV